MMRFAAASFSRGAVPNSAMLVMPAALAAATPAGASSITAHLAGSTPRRPAAIWKTCGSGLPRVTSMPVTFAPNLGTRSSSSSDSATLAGGPDEPTASLNPALCSASISATAPGMTGLVLRTTSR